MLQSGFWDRRMKQPAAAELRARKPTLTHSASAQTYEATCVAELPTWSWEVFVLTHLASAQT
jgi:hypothetical protein